MNTPKPEVLAFADLLHELEYRRKELVSAKKNVPSYTGDRNDEDYYEREQQAYYTTAQKVYDTIFNKSIKD